MTFIKWTQLDWIITFFPKLGFRRRRNRWKALDEENSTRQPVCCDRSSWNPKQHRPSFHRFLSAPNPVTFKLLKVINNFLVNQSTLWRVYCQSHSTWKWSIISRSTFLPKWSIMIDHGSMIVAIMISSCVIMIISLWIWLLIRIRMDVIQYSILIKR